MSNRTIQLNPVFLTTSGKVKASSSTTKTLKKEKPIAPASALVKPNKLKKQLLAKIKDFQVHAEEKGLTHEESKKQQVEDFDKSFNDEFNKSLTFLNDLSKQKGEQHQQKKEHKNTLKRGRIENQVHMHVATELPMELQAQQTQAQQIQAQQPQQPIHQSIHQSIQQPIQQQPQQPIQQHPVGQMKAPPYGILKQGVKPTYREWHKNTQKLNPHTHVPKPLIRIEGSGRGQGQQMGISSNEQAQQMSGRSQILETIKQEYRQKTQSQTQTIAAHIQVPTQIQQPAIQSYGGVGAEPLIQQHGGVGAEPPFKRRITKTTKYKLGKTKGSNKVSVLIKNNQTRRKVQHEIGLLKQKTIMEVKNHLREKNLLKIGSFAPSDVLRQMYEQSILAGDVENKSKDTLIHNFYNDK